MNASDRAFVERVWQTASTPRHVRSHMRKVARVALFVGRAALARGFKLDLRLVENAALVHDASKIAALESGKNEKKLLARVLRSRPALFEIVAQTDLPFVLRNEPFCSIESMIVYYADKRVRHTGVVTLKQRLLDLEKRYPAFVDDIRAAGPIVVELEQALVRSLGFRKNLGGLA